MKKMFFILFILSATILYAQRDNGVHIYKDADYDSTSSGTKSKTKTKTRSQNTINQNLITDSTGKVIRGYQALTFSIGMHPAIIQNGGSASINYNYIEYDYSTGITQKLNADYSKQFMDRKFLWELGVLGYEKNLKLRYREVKTGILMGKHGGSMYLAYGMGIRKELGEGRTAIRFGASFFYTGRVIDIGKIDSHHRDISIGGVEYSNIFYTSGKYGSYKHYSTYIRNNLAYSCIGLKPKLAFDIYSYSKNSSIRFNVGYNIPIYERKVLRVAQYGDGGASGKSHSYDLSDSKINYQYVGSSKNSPYGISGFFVSVELSCKIKTLYKK